MCSHERQIDRRTIPKPDSSVKWQKIVLILISVLRYEVTVEGERHRHRPIVMCLEQILKDAVPDVKPRSASDVCEGSRVAAYWSHQMHCLYTGTVAFGMCAL